VQGELWKATFKGVNAKSDTFTTKYEWSSPTDDSMNKLSVYFAWKGMSTWVPVISSKELKCSGLGDSSVL